MIKNKESFVKKANLLHNGMYDYTKFIYSKSITKSTITCRIHGDFEQSANKHLQMRGCPQCGADRRSDKKVKSKEDRVNLILKKKGLSISDFNINTRVRSKDKILFNCSSHGAFVSTLDIIMSKTTTSCPKCFIEREPFKNNKMSEQVFKRKAKEKGLCKVYFYILTLSNSDESFVKFGVTMNLKVRFSKKLPYNVLSTKYIMIPIDDALSLEEVCRNSNEYKYMPSIKFGGYTECATKDLIDYLILTCKENGLADFSEFKD